MRCPPDSLCLVSQKGQRNSISGFSSRYLTSIFITVYSFADRVPKGVRPIGRFMAEPYKIQDMSNENPVAQASTFESFRRWGYWDAALDPLGFFTPLHHPELQLAGEFADKARHIYCGA